MNKYFFAVLDDKNICVDVRVYYQPLSSPPENYILVSEDDDVLYRKYENGQWSEEKYPPPEPEPRPTIEELIYAESLYHSALLELQMIGG